MLFIGCFTLLWYYTGQRQLGVTVIDVIYWLLHVAVVLYWTTSAGGHCH